MDTNKLQQAKQIIAKQIITIPANTVMDHGTVGAQMGLTKREGEARSMALYIVSRLAGIQWTGTLYENKSQAERDALKVVDQLVADAVAITGK